MLGEPLRLWPADPHPWEPSDLACLCCGCGQVRERRTPAWFEDAWRCERCGTSGSASWSRVPIKGQVNARLAEWRAHGGQVVLGDMGQEVHP